jgi:hypothetical protein
MTWLGIAHYALGWACLLAILAIALWTLWTTIASNADRIVDALSGRPLPPAASVTLVVARTPSRRGVEAAAAPALQVRG